MLIALIRKELRVLSRDLHGLAALFVLPVIFIVVMSMALKDVYSPHLDNLSWSFIDLDNSEASKELVHQWETDNGQPKALPEKWEEALQKGQLKYVIRIEAGAENELLKTEKADHVSVVLLADPGVDAGVFASLEAKIKAAAIMVRAESFLKKLPAADGQTAETVLDPEVIKGANLAGAERKSSGPRPTSVQHNVPAWLVFGMFFVVTTIAGLFVEERNSGTLNRLFSLGASPLQLLIAKVLPFLIINSMQAMLMLGVGIFIIPLLGGDELSLHGINYFALLIMLFSISVAAISLALFVATLVRSQAQASAIGPMMNILMAAIGGIMVPTFVMPEAMQELSHFSPMNWALEGLLNVLLRGGNLSSIVGEVTQLLALAIITLGLAYFIFRIKKS